MIHNCYAVGCQKVGLIAGNVSATGVVTMNNVKATGCTVATGSQGAKALGYVAAAAVANISATNCSFDVKVVKDDNSFNAVWASGAKAQYTLTQADATALGFGAAGDIYVIADYGMNNGRDFTNIMVALLTQCDYLTAGSVEVSIGSYIWLNGRGFNF